MRITRPLQFEKRRLPSLSGDGDEVEVTLLCADVVAFTELTRRLGDRAALRVMRLVAKDLRRHAGAHHGELLEIRGDAFLIAFDSQRSGLRCALRVMRALAMNPASHGGERIQLRMSLHTGVAVKDGGGYFGKAVILAYRLLSRSDVGRIAMTETAANTLPARWLANADRAGCFRPKGFDEEVPYVLVGDAKLEALAAPDDGLLLGLATQEST